MPEGGVCPLPTPLSPPPPPPTTPGLSPGLFRLHFPAAPAAQTGYWAVRGGGGLSGGAERGRRPALTSPAPPLAKVTPPLVARAVTSPGGPAPAAPGRG